MPNITTNHAITYTKRLVFYLITCYVFLICRSGTEPLEGAENLLDDG